MVFPTKIAAGVLISALIQTPAQACLQLSDVTLGMTTAEVEETLDLTLEENPNIALTVNELKHHLGSILSADQLRRWEEINGALRNEAFKALPSYDALKRNQKAFLTAPISVRYRPNWSESNGVSFLVFSSTDRLLNIEKQYAWEGVYSAEVIAQQLVEQNPGSKIEGLYSGGSLQAKIACAEHTPMRPRIDLYLQHASASRGTSFSLSMYSYAPSEDRYSLESFVGGPLLKGVVINVVPNSFDKAHQDSASLIEQLQIERQAQLGTVRKF